MNQSRLRSQENMHSRKHQEQASQALQRADYKSLDEQQLSGEQEEYDQKSEQLSIDDISDDSLDIEKMGNVKAINILEEEQGDEAEDSKCSLSKIIKMKQKHLKSCKNTHRF